ncbi:hypothetical protein MIND_01134600 [Mycena indigotica]|uniref:F-box domain-containing protein n=1 Tax=Mycena indigotica TaxID=2126181 RepID=A0A8H6S7K5_9AGAR|nr:uncharacterized protein MIND_01134600 [Mycena indigotica]KAF7293561.1 hypothetical protein MIND_01134600 [Mycena indigotica]
MTPSVTSPPSPATREALTSFDILGVIFEACLALDFSVEWQSDVWQKMALGAVCRCWRLVLESLPALWSHIILVPRMPQYYIDKVFRLAKAAPKRLSIELLRDSELDTTFLSSVAALLVAKAESVTHLSVHYYSYFAWNTFIDYISAVNSQPNLSSLQRLSATLNQPDTELSHPFPGLTPSLEHLHLDGLNPSSFMIGPNIVTLVLMRWDLVDNPIDSFVFAATLLDCLDQVTNLETLVIDINEPLIAHSIHLVVLPHLNNLTFVCHTSSPHACGTLISQIRVPQAQALTLCLTSLRNMQHFLSMNETLISCVTSLRLVGHISAYIEYTGGQAKLLSSLMGTKLHSLNLFDVTGLFGYNRQRRVFVQTQFLEIIAHTLAIPTVLHLVVPPLLSPPYPDLHPTLIRSLFEPASIPGRTQHVVEEHALCLDSGSYHSKCSRRWSWDHHGLHWTKEASTLPPPDYVSFPESIWFD